MYGGPVRFMLVAMAGGIDRRLLMAGAGELAFLSALPPVSAQEARPAVRFDPDIEPVVKLLEETPRSKLVEEVAARVKAGLSYPDVVAALLLAGIRNIRPRPQVGFKFHAVMVVNSAHAASMASPSSERWLPIFWALDHFKEAQATDVKEGDWTMGPVEEARVPAGSKVREAFVQAMDAWDEGAADVAAAGVARSLGANAAFELLATYGARDLRDIGHKAIYMAGAWRLLSCIGRQHAEPVIRSLAFALLKHEGENPAKADLPADRPWRQNRERAGKIRDDWQGGAISDEATVEMIKALRAGAGPDLVVELLNRGAAPQSVWDGLLAAAGEFLMRQTDIAMIHAVTTTNALHFAYTECSDDRLRRMLLLQAASFMVMFRSRGKWGEDAARIDSLEAEAASGPDEVLSRIGPDTAGAARRVLGLARRPGGAKALMDAARLLVFLKGDDAHDYKFSSAVLEDYGAVSPAWRDRFLAANVFNLQGSGFRDNALVARVRAALGG